MSWFKRIKGGITTSTKEKKETPEGLWHKCSSCKKAFPTNEWMENYWVCSNCDFHDRIGSEEYFAILFDENQFTELDANLTSGDPLLFEDTKKYPDEYYTEVMDTMYLPQAESFNGLRTIDAIKDSNAIEVKEHLMLRFKFLRKYQEKNIDDVA